jgi:hypothetical protein
MTNTPMTIDQFFEEAVNAVNKNLKQVQQILNAPAETAQVAEENRANVDVLFRVAGLQAELAKASALAMIAQAVQATPGTAGITRALEDLGVHLKTGLEVVSETIRPYESKEGS